MRRDQRLLIGGLSAAFVTGCLSWILYFPFRPALVLRVVPPEAVLATWHTRPAGRVEALLKTAPVALILAAADIPATKAVEALAAPGVQALVKRLGGTGAALAFAPYFGGRSEPALVLGAWVGGWTTHMMRAGLLDRSFAGYAVHRIGPDRVWIGLFPELPFGMRYVSFGVYEGVLAGCASSDPFAAVALLAALRRHGALTDLVSPWGDRPGRLSADPGMEPDRFRARLPADGGEPVVCSGDFRLQDDGALGGTLLLEDRGDPSRRPAVLGWTAGGAEDQDPLKVLLPLPGDVPAVLVATTVKRGMAAAAQLPRVRDRLLLAPLAGLAAPGAACQAWISGGQHSGRVMRMKVPSAGFAFQVPAGMGVETAAARVADAINSVYGVGLIAIPDRQDPRIFSLQPVNDVGLFGFLKTEERPAMAITDGWMMVVTNVEVLRRLLGSVAGRPPRQAAEEGGPERLWLYGSSRLPEAGEAASNALAGYALLRLMQTGNAVRLDSPAVRRVLVAMEGLGTVSLRAGHRADGCLLMTWTMDGAGGDSHE
jgi:hypothetical protein